ncbi:multiple epidermal growth factor-like domains protein 11 [Mercenaria mercenaria]|uniref:multiple epidermal growth factor-like domains protein 11 n=1 Tax=Mercenaria mercenaria TaxID=6596 RepID=UPI00234F9BA0|nr:multiple epidermal growth factor-like domains protein 11 [Mercenaria mercenaria]
MRPVTAVLILVSTAAYWFPRTTETTSGINQYVLNPADEHVCQSTQIEYYTDREPYTKYRRQVRYRRCSNVTNTCAEYRTVASTDYRIVTRYRNRVRIFCCDGYEAQRTLLGYTYCAGRYSQTLRSLNSTGTNIWDRDSLFNYNTFPPVD